MIEYQSKEGRSLSTRDYIQSFRNLMAVNRLNTNDAIVLLAMMCADDGIDMAESLIKIGNGEKKSISIFKNLQINKAVKVVGPAKYLSIGIASPLNTNLNDFMDQLGEKYATVLIGDAAKEYKMPSDDPPAGGSGVPDKDCKACPPVGGNKGKADIRSELQAAIREHDAYNRGFRDGESFEAANNSERCLDTDVLIDEFVPHKERSTELYETMDVVERFLCRNLLSINECRLLLDMISDEKDHSPYVRDE